MLTAGITITASFGCASSISILGEGQLLVLRLCIICVWF